MTQTLDTLGQNDSSLEICPECNGQGGYNPKRGETICSECGMVLSEDPVDRGPEWRAFTHQESRQKARVGAPITEAKHDKGLSTTIGWQDRDANGNMLSSHQRRKMQRLRKWDKRYRVRGCGKRHLKQAFGEIDRIASALGLPESTCETASVIYRRAHAEGLLPGRTLEGVATAAVYTAARQENIPRTLDEMTIVARVERKRIGRAYRHLTSELGLAIAPADPTNLLPRFVSELDCSETVHRQARELLQKVIGTPFTNGKCPEGLAATALYAASRQTDEPLTQPEIGEVANVTAKTIRKQYRTFLDHD